MNLFSGLTSWFFGEKQDKQAQEAGQQQQRQRAVPGSGDNSHKRPRSANSPGPVIQDAGYGGSGGVQGLHWYAVSLRTDADGDAAHEFYSEPSTAQGAVPLEREPPCSSTCFLRKVVCTRLGTVQVHGSSIDSSLKKSNGSSSGAG